MIRVAILEDHQPVIDGYLFRLNGEPDIEVVATAHYGDMLEPMMAEHSVDILLLDINVPVSRENNAVYPFFHVVPKLLEDYPNLSILAISMHAQATLIQSVMDAGASGYILKDDHASILQLSAIIRSIASGGIFMSPRAYEQIEKRRGQNSQISLSPRQLEALWMCAAYPDNSMEILAQKMGIAHSTLRNLLSGAYLRLNVRSRQAAVAKATQMGLFPNDPPPFETGGSPEDQSF